MSLAIRLTRKGAKKRPFYRIVVAEATSPRDGKFVEKIGSYNPMVDHDNKERLVIDAERVKYWMSKGAKPTLRVSKLISKDGLVDKPIINERLKKYSPTYYQDQSKIGGQTYHERAEAGIKRNNNHVEVHLSHKLGEDS